MHGSMHALPVRKHLITCEIGRKSLSLFCTVFGRGTIELDQMMRHDIVIFKACLVSFLFYIAIRD